MQQKTFKKACLLRTQMLKVKTAQRDLTTGSKCQVQPKSLCLGHDFLAPGSWFSLLLEEKVHLEDVRLHKPEYISWLGGFSTLAQAPCTVSDHPSSQSQRYGKRYCLEIFPCVDAQCLHSECVLPPSGTAMISAFTFCHLSVCLNMFSFDTQ